MNLSMIYPMFAMVLLTLVVLAVMFMGRVRAVQSGQIQLRYFRTYSDGTPPDQVLKAQRHFSNLFEVPVLFYAGCLAAMVVPILSRDVEIWAWLFVVARVVHACVHLGPNRIRPRMLSYAAGWIAVLGLWITILMKVQIR